MLDKFWDKVNMLAEEARPWMPFTALNTAYRTIDKETKTMLDVGCGPGRPMRFINRRRQFYAVGADLFEQYLKECKRQGTHNEYVLCDVRKLPFKNKSFDTVLCMEVLEHLDKEEGERLLLAMEGLARRQVILSTPVGKYEQKPYDGNPHQQHKYIWRPAEMKGLGYKVRALGIRSIGGREGLIARLPQVI